MYLGETLDRVKAVVVRELNLKNLSSVSNNASFRQLGFDSLELLELMQELEEEFGMDFFPDDYDKLHTVEDVARYVDQKSQS